MKTPNQIDTIIKLGIEPEDFAPCVKGRVKGASTIAGGDDNSYHKLMFNVDTMYLTRNGSLFYCKEGQTIANQITIEQAKELLAKEERLNLYK